MAETLKSESEDDPVFSLKMESDDLPDLSEKDSHEFPVAVEVVDQFQHDLQMDEYHEDSEKNMDEVANLLIGDDNQTYKISDANTYITPDLDESDHREQFLTIPRGKTQITVCDDGNIVYTEDNLLDNITEQYTEKVDQTTLQESSENFYYDGQEEPMQQLECDASEETAEYVQQIIDADGGMDSVMTVDQVSEPLTFIQDQFQISSDMLNVINKHDIKTAIAQDSPRGVKRHIIPTAALGKNVVAKVFVQNSPSGSSSNQPIKIIGNVGSVMGSRHMTLAQAQRLGLISSSSKLISNSSAGTTPGRLIVKKVVPSGGSSLLAMKQPAKILPAPSAKPRTPITTVRASVSGTPIRSAISLSQLKAYNAVGSSSQIRPIAITRTLGSLSMAKNDAKSPQKVYVRPGGTVLSPVTGQLTRLPINATFQPIQVGGKQQLQYVKLISGGPTLTSGDGMKAKLVKPMRNIPIAPSPVLPKPPTTSGSVVGRRLILSADGDKISTVQVKSASTVLPGAMKGKVFTMVKSPEPVPSDNVADDDSEKTLSQVEVDDMGDKENFEDGEPAPGSPSRLLEANGIRPKKPCNCTKSQCLKLYCECFANGEFCFQCNCHNCFNNIDHEEERQMSIKSCLERNPAAFRPKFQIRDSVEEEKRRHKGCNCKRSYCLKNYCECYESKMSCSKACKCVGCRNNEDVEFERSQETESGEEGEHGMKSLRFMSPSLAEALCQCILAQAEVAERKGDDTEATERSIIEEFGQCLVQIIGNRNKRDSR